MNLHLHHIVKFPNHVSVQELWTILGIRCRNGNRFLTGISFVLQMGNRNFSNIPTDPNMFQRNKPRKWFAIQRHNIITQKKRIYMIVLSSFQRLLRVIRPEAPSDVQKSHEMDNIYMDGAYTAWSHGRKGTAWTQFNGGVLATSVGRREYISLSQGIHALSLLMQMAIPITLPLSAWSSMWFHFLFLFW